MALSDASVGQGQPCRRSGGVAAAFEAVRSQFPGIPVEVEVDSLTELDEVVAAGADLVLLDNFTADQMTGGRAPRGWSSAARGHLVV